jgi:ATP-binding cassette subfamily B protein
MADRGSARHPAPGQAVRAVATLVGAAFRADRARATAVLVLAPVAGVTTAVVGLATRGVINSVISRNSGSALLSGGLLIAAAVLGYLASTVASDLRIRLQQSVGLLLDQEIIGMCSTIPHLDHHEYPPYLDRLELLRAHRSELGAAFGSLVENLRALTSFGSTIGLLISVRPALAALLIPALPTVLAVQHSGRRTAEAEQATVGLDRLRRGLFRLACSPDAARELRVYGLQAEMAIRHDELQDQVNGPRLAANVSTGWWTSAGWLVFGAGFVVAVGYIVDAAAHGQASPGDVVLTIMLGSQLATNVTSLVQMVTWLQRSVRSTGYFLWLADFARASTAAAARSAAAAHPAEAARPATPARRAVAAGARRRGVSAAGSVPSGPIAQPGGDLVLDKVSFGYPGTEARVLREVSLVLPAGQTIAVVGENGAGKTTLVKLLCGMYAPTSGQIRYAGTDLAGYDLAGWRRGLTACFQDFCKLEFLLRESVGTGDLAAIDDEQAVLAAMAGAGAAHLPGLLPRGLETQLGISFTNGTDLSTGQWQKLAMSRAGMRPAPVLRILDEPAASLDPASEYEIFARYQAVARQAGSASITVFVSHRFATVRMADLIVVLDGGRVRESGDHGALMARGDLYAQLYTLHARGYQNGQPTLRPAAAS